MVSKFFKRLRGQSKTFYVVLALVSVAQGAYIFQPIYGELQDRGLAREKKIALEAISVAKEIDERQQSIGDRPQ